MLCRACGDLLKSYTESSQSTDTEEACGDLSKSYTESSQSTDTDPDDTCSPSPAKRLNLNQSLSLTGISPINLHSVAQHRRGPAVVEKLSKVVDTFKSNLLEVYSIEDVPAENSSSTLKAQDLDILLDDIKKKLINATYKEKIQLLTLTPDSWSRRFAAEFFNVSEYAIRTAQKLKEENGILAIPDSKTRNKLPPQTTELIKLFYNDDEYSRQMPGKKDFVSVKKNVHVQKRLILCNLKELHAAFKNKYPNLKIGFSKFYYLKPKWCVTAGMSGTHSVCVCHYHQNAILLVDALNWDYSYKDLINILVCDAFRRECMVHRCDKCPGTESLKAFVDEKLQDYDDDMDISFNQWQTTDRSTLIKQTATIDEYKEILIKDIDSLTAHSYIAKSQASYLKQKKINLNENEAVILGDFAENYKFLIQDEIQSYHWTNESCTLHPIVIYTASAGKLKTDSLCFISDDNNHDTNFVYEVQEKTMMFIKENYPLVSKVYYFSDGCGGQYKNYKNFINLCHHKEDFGLNAEWIFFATSHGKSPCDGIGGTVKRYTTKRSLQRPLKDQICTYEAMLELCIQEIKGIKFYGISKERMENVRYNLLPRFQSGKTVPGTRIYHHFIPISTSAISFKRTSEDTDVTGTFSFSDESIDIPLVNDVKESDFISCIYDNHWWIGLVQSVDLEQGDVKVNFMHPHGPNLQFHWPSRNDICYVPTDKLLCKISTPITSTGRLYSINEADYSKIVTTFKKI